MTVRLDQVRPGDGPLPRYARACERCGVVFLGIKSARYCCKRCANRAREQERDNADE